MLQMLRRFWSNYASISLGFFNIFDSFWLAALCPESGLKCLYFLCDWKVHAFSSTCILSSVSFSGNRFKGKVIQELIDII